MHGFFGMVGILPGSDAAIDYFAEAVAGSSAGKGRRGRENSCLGVTSSTPSMRPPLDQLLEALPGGFNAIPDIIARRAALEQLGRPGSCRRTRR